VSRQSIKECGDCQEEFTPTPDNEKFCTRCNAIFEVQKEREFEEGDGYYGDYEDDEPENDFPDGYEDYQTDMNEQIKEMNK